MVGVKERVLPVTRMSQFSHTDSCLTASGTAGGQTGHETPDRRTISVFTPEMTKRVLGRAAIAALELLPSLTGSDLTISDLFSFLFFFFFSKTHTHLASSFKTSFYGTTFHPRPLLSTVLNYLPVTQRCRGSDWLSGPTA